MCASPSREILSARSLVEKTKSMCPLTHIRQKFQTSLRGAKRQGQKRNGRNLILCATNSPYLASASMTRRQASGYTSNEGARLGRPRNRNWPRPELRCVHFTLALALALRRSLSASCRLLSSLEPHFPPLSCFSMALGVSALSARLTHPAAFFTSVNVSPLSVKFARPLFYTRFVRAVNFIVH